MAEPFDPDDEALARPSPPLAWRARLEHLADATGSSPGRLLAGTVAVAVVLVAGYLLTRPPTPPPETALPFATTLAAPAATVTSTTAPTELVIHVAGAVNRPGVTRVAAGARVVDAVDAAGGLAPQADGSQVNLAAPVADGERVYIPAIGEIVPPPLVGAGPGGGAAAPSGPLDLNTATVDQLDELPGVGPATATAIVSHRDRIGGFTSVDQLLDVRGIGEAKLEQLRPLVTV